MPSTKRHCFVKHQNQNFPLQNGAVLVQNIMALSRSGLSGKTASIGWQRAGHVLEEFPPGLEDDPGRLPQRVLGLVTQMVPFWLGEDFNVPWRTISK
jgi:hypothetical protein